jgi:N-acetylglucosamine malate deacetylase 1
MMTVLAIGCHPDDIEFQMAGTLLLLKKAGWDVHILNVANGSVGSMTLRPEQISAVRWREASKSAGLLGATIHECMVDDLEVFYTQDLIRRVTGLVRQVKPDMVLTLSLEDYMDDHMNAAKLAVTGTFLRGVGNYRSIPDMPAVLEDAMLYHGTPLSGTDMMRRPIVPELYVDVTSVIDEKERLLACHESQKEWLDKTQGFDSYLKTMRDGSAAMGTLSGRCRFAEGWRRHEYAGFTQKDCDPLSDALKRFVVPGRAPEALGGRS